MIFVQSNMQTRCKKQMIWIKLVVDSPPSQGQSSSVWGQAVEFHVVLSSGCSPSEVQFSLQNSKAPTGNEYRLREAARLYSSSFDAAILSVWPHKN